MELASIDPHSHKSRSLVQIDLIVSKIEPFDSV